MKAMLVFDLDGTISNPAAGIGQAINYALGRHGYPLISPDEVARFIGPPLKGTFHELTGAERPVILDLIASYRECYQESCIQNEIYPGVADALAELQGQGVSMGICTSKRADFAERILNHLGLRGYFSFISGGDVDIEKWQQLAALKEAGTIPPGSVMIGDRDVDIQAGKRNGLRTGGVLWGFGDRQELESEQTDFLFTQPGEWLGIGGV